MRPFPAMIRVTCCSFALVPLFWALRGQSRPGRLLAGHGQRGHLLPWASSSGSSTSPMSTGASPCPWRWGCSCSWPSTCPSTGACGPGGWSRAGSRRHRPSCGLPRRLWVVMGTLSRGVYPISSSPLGTAWGTASRGSPPSSRPPTSSAPTGCPCLLVLVNIGLVLVFSPPQPGTARAARLTLALLVILMAAWFAYGHFRLGTMAKVMAASPKCAGHGHPREISNRGKSRNPRSSGPPSRSMPG